MEFHLVTTRPVSFQNTTIIIPIVSTANLGQLAVDLLVSSLGLERVGIFDSDFVFPAVGGREDGSTGVTTPLELFGKKGFPFYFLQQRSPVIKSCKSEFVSSLISFVQQHQFSSVLILSGLDLSHRDDSHMLNQAYHLLPISNAAPDQSSELVSRLPSIIPPYTQKQDISSLRLPSSGITKLLLLSLPASGFPSTGVVLQYVLEGDNREDAYLMATNVARTLGLQEFKWKEPSSWKQGLFGAPHDQTLFG